MKAKLAVILLLLIAINQRLKTRDNLKGDSTAHVRHGSNTGAEAGDAATVVLAASEAEKPAGQKRTEKPQFFGMDCQ